MKFSVILYRISPGILKFSGSRVFRLAFFLVWRVRHSYFADTSELPQWNYKWKLSCTGFALTRVLVLLCCCCPGLWYVRWRFVVLVFEYWKSHATYCSHTVRLPLSTPKPPNFDSFQFVVAIVAWLPLPLPIVGFFHRYRHRENVFAAPSPSCTHHIRHSMWQFGRPHMHGERNWNWLSGLINLIIIVIIPRCCTRTKLRVTDKNIRTLFGE